MKLRPLRFIPSLRPSGRMVAVVGAVALALLVLLPASARAHVNSGANCASCHSGARSGMSVTGFQLTTNLGAGSLKVFVVRPGETAPIGIQVTDGHSEYGLALVNLTAGGIRDPGHHLSFQADSSWTRRTSTPNYYSAGPSSSNKAWTFRLGVQAGTPADFYLLQLRMAGTGGGRWSQEERFYVQVLAPAPTAPAISQPTWSGGVFTCQVPTSAGYTYFLEARAPAAGAAWTTVAQTAGDGSAKTLTDPQAAHGATLYRIRVE